MGQPVVHFEILGRDASALHAYYSELFGWKVHTYTPMNQGVVLREDNLNPDGIGIGGSIGSGPEGYAGHVTVYIEVPDVEAALARAAELGGTRVMGPVQVREDLAIGQFLDPEGHLIGVVQAT